MLSISQILYHIIIGCLLMNWKQCGSGRGIIWVWPAIPAFSWRSWVNPRKTQDSRSVGREGSFISRWRFEIKNFHLISEINTLNFQHNRRTVIFLSVQANGLYTVSSYRSNSDLFLHVSVIVKCFIMVTLHIQTYTHQHACMYWIINFRIHYIWCWIAFL